MTNNFGDSPVMFEATLTIGGTIKANFHVSRYTMSAHVNTHLSLAGLDNASQFADDAVRTLLEGHKSFAICIDTAELFIEPFHVVPATVAASEYAKGIVTVADIACEPYSIERVEDTVYVEIDRKTNTEIAWGYCIDGIGIYWFDSMEELNEEYDVYDLVEYIDGQLQV